MTTHKLIRTAAAGTVMVLAGAGCGSSGSPSSSNDSSSSPSQEAGAKAFCAAQAARVDSDTPIPPAVVAGATAEQRALRDRNQAAARQGDLAGMADTTLRLAIICDSYGVPIFA